MLAFSTVLAFFITRLLDIGYPSRYLITARMPNSSISLIAMTLYSVMLARCTLQSLPPYGPGRIAEMNHCTRTVFQGKSETSTNFCDRKMNHISKSSCTIFHHEIFKARHHTCSADLI